ncbi:hypothetical protein NPIL_248861 [Nephila pilipes]|uniref:Uncharacterized protein n=1 Tax=Nephila pilipes TaxID=299642 RepID=A0A8X6QUD2_NEPPI|nr:hypothetical protein NPIL_248861 [Nephila pilipes]
MAPSLDPRFKNLHFEDKALLDTWIRKLNKEIREQGESLNSDGGCAPEIVEEQIGPRIGISQISVFPYSRCIIKDESTLQGSPDNSGTPLNITGRSSEGRSKRKRKSTPFIISFYFNIP